MEPVALRRRESEEESVWLTEVLQVSEDGALLYVVEGRMLRRPTVSTSARYTVLRVHVGTGQVEEITRLRAIHA